MRKMATIRTIDKIVPHPNADKLDLAIIGGWQCVVLKDEFTAGQQAVYLEIDSWVPTAVAPFLTKGAKTPREFEGVQGERLKTIRLRGEVSQGLVLPLSVLPRGAMDAINASTKFPLAGEDGLEVFSSIDGWDVTDVLGVKKWERAVAANMRGNARRYFPAFIQKTDQERIQNMLRTLEKRDPEEVFEVTLKLDGSSTTFYVHAEGREEGPEAGLLVIDTGVCSRNLELKTDESNAGNVFVQKYNELRIATRLRDFYDHHGYSIALQGELCGTGINGNWEGIDGILFSLFDVFNCDTYKYLDADARKAVLEWLNYGNGADFPIIRHAPVIGTGTLADFGLGSLKIEDFLAFAKRPSLYNPVAEGVVFKSLKEPGFSFKVVNNEYLLAGGN